MNDLIVMDGSVAVLDAKTAADIAEFERQMKVIKDREDALKQAILSEMESKGIIKIETEEMTITYVAPTDRETFDGKTFRKDHADLYDEYVRISPVKSSVRIKLK